MQHDASKLALVLLLALPLAACSKEDTTKAADSMKSAASATGDKLVEMKDKFVAATQKEMSDLSASYEKLEAKASAASEEAKAGLKDMLADIKEKKDELAREFEDSKKAHDGSSFEAAKAKVKDGMADLKRRIDEAWQKLK